MDERILFITGTRIGDAILSAGALEHLIETRPRARFTIACGPPAAALFARLPRLERVIVMEKRRNGGHWLALWRACVGLEWDLCVDLRGSWTTRFLRARARRIWRPASTPLPKADEAARVLGLADTPAPRIHWGPAEEAVADRLLPAGRPVLALGPGANWSGKRWPAARFAALARALLEGPLAGACVFLAAGPDERDAAPAAAADLPAGTAVIDAGIGLPLLETAACLARARLFVGNDSGLMHLAAAAGAPTLGLFGPTDERLYAPVGRLAASVRGPDSFEALTREPPRHGEGEERMAGLTVEAAFEAARALLARSAA